MIWVTTQVSQFKLLYGDWRLIRESPNLFCVSPPILSGNQMSALGVEALVTEV